jgi:hypothetical protein
MGGGGRGGGKVGNSRYLVGLTMESAKKDHPKVSWGGEEGWNVQLPGLQSARKDHLKVSEGGEVGICSYLVNLPWSPLERIIPR